MSRAAAPDTTDAPPRKKVGGARPGAGRKPFVPTDEERKKVEELAGYGLPLEHICVLVRNGISVPTLREKFERELVAGKAKANSAIGQTLFAKAMGGDTTAAIWWSKTQMQWSETHKLANPDGSALLAGIKVAFVSAKNAQAEAADTDAHR